MMLVEDEMYTDEDDAVADWPILIGGRHRITISFVL